MNRHFFSFIMMAALFVAVFSSCNKEATEEIGTEPITVNLKAEIKPSVTTRVAYGQWEASDQVGLFMKRAGQSLTDFGAIYGNADNIQMGITGQTLTSNPPLMYPSSGNVDFVAYYPYFSNHYYHTDYLMLPVNVAGQEGGLPVEILYSNNAINQVPTASPVTLNFKYSLAKIELTVTDGANSNLDANDFAGIDVTVEELYTRAKLQLADGTFIDYDDKLPVKLRRKNSNASSATFEALVLPTNEEITFLFDVGGTVYRHKMNVNYASATLYKYAFSLENSGINLGIPTLLNADILPRDEEPQQNIQINATSQITMTTESSEVSFEIGGTGKMAIDWGDGTPLDEYMLSSTWPTSLYTYKYSNISPRTITIISENITSFGSINNQLTSLDVNKNIALIGLFCSKEYELKNLDVSKNISLKSLSVRETQLKSLDVSKNISLTNLQCFYNYQLEELDVRNNIELEIFICSGNKLKELDVRNNISLEILSCSRNQLNELDVSNNNALRLLDCSENHLTNLDVSENTALITLYCGYNQFDDINLNALFGTLHSNNITYYNDTKTIRIMNNPGTDTCDRSIAEIKGWTVLDIW